MNENSFTLRPHVMKLCIVTYKTYQMVAIRIKTANIVSMANITSAPPYLFVDFGVRSTF